MKNFSLSFYSKIIITIFVAMFIWWVSINIQHMQDTSQNFFYGAMLGVLPVLGALFGFVNSKRWGGFSSSMGKSVFFLSLGLFTWGIGTLIFAYYNIYLQIAVPYPSIADLFYIVSWPLWVVGMLQLSHATGARYSLQSSKGKAMLLFIPILVILISYYLLVVVGRGGVLDVSLDGGGLKLFFDLAYPIGDVVVLSLAALIYSLSYSYLGGKFKWAIYFIIIGFIANYLADFSFSYTTTLETFYTAGWVDLLFTVAMFILSIGVTSLDPKVLTTNNES